MRHSPPSRRILTFPAVHPCQSVSVATLLSSLMAVARDIQALRSESFPVHRRSAREAIRLTGALLVFLEDIGDRAAILPSSAVLTFFELHVTLQKLRFLLCDCARKDARLWILMRSDRVSSEFRMLVRSIATALDVIPLDFIGAAKEVKELVRLVTRQAWSVDIATDSADDLAAQEVRWILNQFENGVAPAQSNLRRLLGHLQIRSWTECNEEIMFLEEEMLGGNPNEENGEATLLCSLSGFMIYCRVVLFDVAGDRKRSSWKELGRFQDAGISHINPEDLRCPISLELMTDPVTVSTGQTYDRASIVKWLKSRCLTCPVTGEKLANTELVPNSTVRNLIVQLCHSNNIAMGAQGDNRRDLSKTLLPGSSAAAGAIRMAAAFIVNKLANGTRGEPGKAAYEIRLLSKSNLFNRACFVEADSIPCLLQKFSSSDPSTQEHAVAAVLNLSKIPQGRVAIVEAGGLRPILDVFQRALAAEAQQSAAAILFYLSSVEEYRKEIGELPEAIPSLVSLLKEGGYRGKKNAVVTLFGLLSYPGNYQRILAAGAIPALIDLLPSEREDLLNDSIGVLAKMAERPEGTKEIVGSSASLPLVNVLRSSTSRSGKEYCVSLMLSLCNNGGTKVVRLLQAIPVLMPALYSLSMDGSSQAGKKARSLLNHLHQLSDEDNPDIIAPSIHDHIIHAQ